jgi:SAM-dependent methyltransferase
VFALKDRVKRSRRLATLIFYLTDLLYLDLRERKRFIRSFDPGARLLNLGAGFRVSPPGFLGVDREGYLGIDLRADLCALPFPSDTVDGILCEMVLEHVPDALDAIAEFHRVLKPGGRLYIAVPFLWPYHASPHDYWRWTLSGVERAFRKFDRIEVGVTGGPTTTLVNVLHEWLAMVLSLGSDALYRALYLLLIPVLFPWKLLDVLVSRHQHAAKLGALFHFHGRKPSSLSP